MLAYVFWHRAAAGVERGAYEQALERFHRSLAHRPPSGFHGSGAFRLYELPWLAPLAGAEQAAGYEDWYLVEDWAALGVLEAAAISRGHLSAHEDAAAHTGAGAGAVYRLLEGSVLLGEAAKAVWVATAPGRKPVGLGELLADGIDPARAGLWRRCLVLGPAPEYCLLAAGLPPGVAATRLPSGWRATETAREIVWCGG